MSFEEEFDSIIRQKADGADFPFDEKNWEKARKLLDAEREKAGMGLMAKFAIVAVLFLGLASTAWFLFERSNGTPSELAATEATTNTPATGIPLPSQPERNTTLTAPEPATSPSAKTPAAPEERTVPASTEKQIGISDAGNTAIRTTVTPSPEKQTTQNTVVSNQHKPVITNSPVEKNNNDVLATTHTPEPKIIPSVAANNSDTPKNPSELNAPVSKTTPVAKEEKQNEEVQPESMTAQTASVDQLMVESVALFIPELPVSSDPEITPAQINVLNYFDDDDYYTKEKYKKHYLNAEAGGAYLYGWAATNTRDGQGINWYGGLNYGIYLTKKSDISIGLQGYNIGNIHKAFFDESQTRYGFSSVTTRTTITTNSLYYLAVPIKFTFAVSTQHSFGFGFNAGMLLHSQNTMQTFYKSEVKTETNSVNTKGYYEGMNPTNIMVTAFYRTRFGERLYLNGELTWSPVNIYKYADSKVNTANTIGIRVGLQFNLFDK